MAFPGLLPQPLPTQGPMPGACPSPCPPAGALCLRPCPLRLLTRQLECRVCNHAQWCPSSALLLRAGHLVLLQSFQRPRAAPSLHPPPPDPALLCHCRLWTYLQGPRPAVLAAWDVVCRSHLAPSPPPSASCLSITPGRTSPS